MDVYGAVPEVHVPDKLYSQFVIMASVTHTLHLKYGVFVLMLRCVPGGVFPWDPEAHGVTVEPHQTRISPAVHLSDQPGLQANTSRGDRHPGRQREHKPVSPEPLPRLSGTLTPLNDEPHCSCVHPDPARPDRPNISELRACSLTGGVQSEHPTVCALGP